MIIAASIPTRGDVDVSQLEESLIPIHFNADYLSLKLMGKSKVRFVSSPIYDNSRQINFQVFSRYVHASGFDLADYIYTQDDDCIVPIEDLLRDPVVHDALDRNKIVCNIPESHYANYKYTPEKLVGFGCLFPHKLIAPTFNLYLKYFPIDDLLLREADRIFTGINTENIIVTHHPITHLPHATSPTRMYHQPGHEEYRKEARDRVHYLLFLTGKSM
jgi:hypothetical protein